MCIIVCLAYLISYLLFRKKGVLIFKEVLAVCGIRFFVVSLLHGPAEYL